jgi:uncharacterized protein (DUF2126 family)
LAIHVALRHVTAYRYDRRVGLSPQLVRLRPAPHCRTPILAYALKVTPAQHFVNWQQDPQSNYVARLTFPDPVTELRIEVDLVAEMAVYNPFDFFLEPYAEQAPFPYEEWQLAELQPFLRKEPLTPRFSAYLETVDVTPRRTIDFLVDLNRRLQQDIGYVIRLDPGVQTKEETLELGRGSCRDTTWLLVQLLRHLGLAARFVSGYLIQLTPDVAALDGPTGPTQDFTDLHAWCEVYLPGAGWVGLDPTSGLLAGEGHIPLSCTPEPSSAAPVTGAVDDCEVEFSHEMHVQRVYESPRVTKPYTDEQWTRIVDMGRQVDAALEQEDVRLTMGGEPTFVSIDDRDGVEWTTSALGPTKRLLASDLLWKLRRHYGEGGFVHFGQGKWYPGEQLPRWALGCYWRRDGEPAWRDASLFADERRDYGYGAADAERFLRALAARLGVTDEHVQAGYEDVWYYLWRERRLPVNVDPFDTKLDDELERDRLRAVFSRGLKSIVGYALPIARHVEKPADKKDKNKPGTIKAATGGAARDVGGSSTSTATTTATSATSDAGSGAATAPAPRWRTGSWFLRAERLYLMPGDSPMGYRLPLGSLPWVNPGDYPFLHERDPFEQQPPLPAADALRGEASPLLQTATLAGSRVPSSERTLAGDRVPFGVAAVSGAALSGAAASGAGPSGAAGSGAAPSGAAPSGPALSGLAADRNTPARGESAPWVARTSFVAEVRNGVLYIFMPPVSALEDYLELVAAVEQTAAALNLHVLMEGYPPPSDPRLAEFQITPDPGVIEVNIQPARGWTELVEQTTTLYDEAHQTRLTTEKFMMDGRHVGTGGGNHFVLGGATAADSPFLRRPDLLRSLVAYWHNHPSLSYLFSGMFLGPTSQAPRVDEARHDSVYELEIAFARLPDRSQTAPPWLVDRVFRHLLTDVTGNTHRAEFCIDKLYSPDSASGRRGLLEMRAFEMPPHARMSLAQQLLLRALIARFWREPYVAPLTRWGTELHDRFMLPYFVWLDFEDVLGELARTGFAIDKAWFAPHLEFRFPLAGEFATRAVHLTLRQALEPWHVLGEEGMAGTTVRYVDSSLERLQLLVSGLTPDRYAIACNGRALPLQPTGRNGEYVAGVRFRAWQPASALHPTIPVHAPLTFDLVDTWLQRSLGGCQYHVMHPGGRNYDKFPVNSYEAESRRLARFSTIGHTPGTLRVPPAERSREFPYTLDLRT